MRIGCRESQWSRRRKLQLSGTVTSQAAAPIAGARIDVVDPSSDSIIATAFTDSEGRYALSIAAGTYDIMVTPAPGTGFQPVNLTNQVINEDTIINFILVPSEPQTLITFSGRVTDRFGNGINGISITGGGVVNGSYSNQLPPGNYPLRFHVDEESGSNTRGSIPKFFTLTGPTLNLNQDTVLDITIPGLDVQVHVQDPSGNPIANAVINAVATPGTPQSLNTSSGLMPFTIDRVRDAQLTDSAGNAVMQLLPGDSPANYSFTISAPDSGATRYEVKTFNQVVTPEMNLNVVLEPKLTLITFSGRVTDRFGNGINGISITGGGVVNGSYSNQLPPGNYPLRFHVDEESGSNTRGSIPKFFTLTGPTLNLNQDTVLDITIPGLDVQVHVQDPSGNPIANAVINAVATPGTPQSLNTSSGLMPFTIDRVRDAQLTDSAGNAVMQLLPGDSPANYSFTISAPDSGATRYEVKTFNQVVTPEMNLNVVLEPKLTLITFSGRVTDRFGNGINGISITGGGVVNGSYSNQLPPGNYPLRFHVDEESGSNTRGSIPKFFTLTGPTLNLNQDTVLDITIPGLDVQVHVQDPSGNPIANAVINAVATPGTPQSLNTSSGLMPFTIDRVRDAQLTDSAGNAVMQLLPGDSPANYRFSVTPPFGSGLMGFDAPKFL